MISYMQANGLNVIKVIVPTKRSQRLDAAIMQLRDKGFDVSEVNKDNLAVSLDSLLAYPLLSLGFPHIVPKRIFEKHPLAINVHPTLLPKYRGPSSGAYILMNGEEKSGSTVHLMVDEVDKGAIVLQREVPFSPFDTIRSMQQKVYRIEPKLVVDAINQIDQCAPLVELNEEESSLYPKKRFQKILKLIQQRRLLNLLMKYELVTLRAFQRTFFIMGRK